MMKTTNGIFCLILAATFVSYTECWWSRSPSSCSESECSLGTCVQVGTNVMRSCSGSGYYSYPTFHDELRRKRGFHQPRYLYRMLRDNEDARNEGIRAKNPQANKSIQSHVGCGSRPNYSSQYISCTSDYDAVLDFGRLDMSNNFYRTINIAVIDRDRLERDGYIVHDLNEAGRDVLTGIMAYNFAHRYNEVLVERFIPPAYIVEVRHVIISARRNRC